MIRTALAALALVVTSALPGFAADGPPVPTLTANGEGSVTVVPDVMIVNLGVVTRDRDAAGALDANSAAVAKVVAAVKAAGVDDKDIGTSGININPIYPPVNDEQVTPRIVGYEVSNQIRVTIRDLAKAGTILDQVVAAGANQMNGIGFDISNREGPSRQALNKAIADALATGARMATAAHVKLVRILSVTGGESGGFMPMMARAADMKAVPVMPGSQTVNATASIVWEIAPE